MIKSRHEEVFLSYSSCHTYLSSGSLWLVCSLVHRTHTQHWYGTQCWAAGLHRNRETHSSQEGLRSSCVKYLWDPFKQLCGLTLQQECVGGSTNINLLDVIICGCGVVTNDKARDVAWCGNMGDSPCHPNVVSAHSSKLQVGGSWNGWKSEGL